MRVKKPQDVTFPQNANNTTTSNFLDVGGAGRIGSPNKPALMNNTQTSAFTFMGIQSSKHNNYNANATNNGRVNHQLALQTGFSTVSSSVNNRNEAQKNLDDFKK